MFEYVVPQVYPEDSKALSWFEKISDNLVFGFFVEYLNEEEMKDIISKVSLQTAIQIANHAYKKRRKKDIKDFKVINEVLGYVPGDDVIALLRMAAIKYPELTKNFDIIIIRGPPGGFFTFLMPKSIEDAELLVDDKISEMFIPYMKSIQNKFNHQSKVKIGHLATIWDRINDKDANVASIFEHIDKTRKIYEYSPEAKVNQNIVLKYNSQVESDYEQLRFQIAIDALESRQALQKRWNLNRELEKLEADINKAILDFERELILPALIEHSI